MMKGPDAPTKGDARRMRAARSKSRAAMADAAACYAASSIDAFRREIGGTVRSVSPFLITLLTAEGLLLDDVAEAIEPAYGWPRRPRTSLAGDPWLGGKHMFRHVAAGLRHYIWPDTLLTPGANVDLSDYTSAKVRIIAHSIEVRVCLNTVTFDTCFGMLRIELGRALPETLAIACTGRLVDEVIDHPLLRGSGWRILTIESALAGSVLVVETGSAPYRLPWER